MRTTKQTTRLSEYASFTVEACDCESHRTVVQISKSKINRVETPLMIIKERREDQRVSARDEVQKLLAHRRAVSTHAGTCTMRALLSTNLGFFIKLEDKHSEDHSHDDPRLQREDDKRFGLIPYRK